MPIAQTERAELSYERSGTGPPLLLIMGMSGTFAHWDGEFLAALQAEHEVIVYDHRGVGASSRVEQPFTIADLAGDALALLDALAIERVAVLGFSMGGMVAQELVLAAPDRVSALVQASTYCGGEGSSSASAQTLEKLGTAISSGDRGLAMRTNWEVNVSPAFAANAAAFARFQEIGERRRVAVKVIFEQIKAIAAHDTSGRLGAIRAPTLVLHGTADQMLPSANARMIAGLIGDARLELLPGLGHLFFWENPERSAALVNAHLAANAPAGAARAPVAEAPGIAS